MGRRTPKWLSPLLVALALWCAWAWASGDRTTWFGAPVTHETFAATAGPTNGKPSAAPSPAVQGASATQATTTFSGKVRSSAGEPLSGARVCAVCADCFAMEKRPDPRCVVTDAEGHYALAELAAGNYRIFASARGYEIGLVRGGQSLRAAGDDSKDNDLDLEQGGAQVSGLVLDALGGPVASAVVQATFSDDKLPRGRLLEQTVRSDASGAFSLVTPRGKVRIFAHADGYAVGTAFPYAPAANVQLVLTPASRISGTVVSSVDGSPVNGLQVKALGARGGDITTSNTSGAFSLTGLGPGTYNLEAFGRGFIGRHPGSVTIDLGDAVDDLVLTVHPGVNVSGTVMVGEAPCVAGKAYLLPAPGSSGPRLEARTDLDGRVVFEAVPPARYVTLASCEHRGNTPEQMVEVGAQDVTGLSWVLPRGTDVVVHVQQPDGRPVPRALVQLAPLQPASPVDRRVERTDELGLVRFDSVTAGMHVISCPEDPSTATELRIDASGQAIDVPIVLKDRAAVEVTVTDAQGEPNDRVVVTATSVDTGQPGIGEPRGSGHFYVGPLPDGRYRVEVRDGTNPVLRVGGPEGLVTLESGQLAKVEATYGGRGGVIRGRVVDTTGSPLANVWVSAEPSSATPDSVVSMLRQFEPARTLSDPGGSFELQGLDTDGVFSVVASYSLGGQARLDGVTVGQQVELTMHAPASLAGRVLDTTGRPPAYFELSVSNAQSNQRLVSKFGPDANGSFSIEHIAPGEIEILAIAPDGVARVQQAVAPSQRLRDLSLQLTARGAPKQLAASAESPAMTGATNERKDR